MGVAISRCERGTEGGAWRGKSEGGVSVEKREEKGGGGEGRGWGTVT